jgi:hypothetical protein
MRRALVYLIIPVVAFATGCSTETEQDQASTTEITLPESLPNGLVLAMSVAEKGDEEPIDRRAQLGMLVRKDGSWQFSSFDDPDSDSYSMAMDFRPVAGEPGILTLGANRAMLKLWHPASENTGSLEIDLGGFGRGIADIQVAPLLGTDHPVIVAGVGGAVVLLKPNTDGAYAIEQLERDDAVIVTRLQIGDLTGDGVSEIYSARRLAKAVSAHSEFQTLLRYVPADGKDQTPVSRDLQRKLVDEFLVDDVDGDGLDELYASAVDREEYAYRDEERVVKVLRYDEGLESAPSGVGFAIATIPDQGCRYLASGDVDGDGHKELVAVGLVTGAWLLRHVGELGFDWSLEQVDPDSEGSIHAAVLADLDEDGADEFYTADDSGNKVIQYRWHDGVAVRNVIHTYTVDLTRSTMSIMAVPAALLQ